MNTKIIFFSTLLTLYITIISSDKNSIAVDRNGFPQIVKAKTSPPLSFQNNYEDLKPEQLNSSNLYSQTSFDLSTPQTTSGINPATARKNKKRKPNDKGTQTITAIIAQKADKSTGTENFRLPDIHQLRRNQQPKSVESSITLQCSSKKPNAITVVWDSQQNSEEQ